MSPTKLYSGIEFAVYDSEFSGLIDKNANLLTMGYTNLGYEKESYTSVYRNPQEVISGVIEFGLIGQKKRLALDENGSAWQWGKENLPDCILNDVKDIYTNSKADVVGAVKNNAVICTLGR